MRAVWPVWRQLRGIVRADPSFVSTSTRALASSVESYVRVDCCCNRGRTSVAAAAMASPLRCVLVLAVAASVAPTASGVRAEDWDLYGIDGSGASLVGDRHDSEYQGNEREQNPALVELRQLSVDVVQDYYGPDVHEYARYTHYPRAASPVVQLETHRNLKRPKPRKHKRADSRDLSKKKSKRVDRKANHELVRNAIHAKRTEKEPSLEEVATKSGKVGVGDDDEQHVTTAAPAFTTQDNTLDNTVANFPGLISGQRYLGFQEFTTTMAYPGASFDPRDIAAGFGSAAGATAAAAANAPSFAMRNAVAQANPAANPEANEIWAASKLMQEYARKAQVAKARMEQILNKSPKAAAGAPRDAFSAGLPAALQALMPALTHQMQVFSPTNTTTTATSTTPCRTTTTTATTPCATTSTTSCATTPCASSGPPCPCGDPSADPNSREADLRLAIKNRASDLVSLQAALTKEVEVTAARARDAALAAGDAAKHVQDSMAGVAEDAADRAADFGKRLTNITDQGCRRRWNARGMPTPRRRRWFSKEKEKDRAKDREKEKNKKKAAAKAKRRAARRARRKQNAAEPALAAGPATADATSAAAAGAVPPGGAAAASSASSAAAAPATPAAAPPPAAAPEPAPAPAAAPPPAPRPAPKKTPKSKPKKPKKKKPKAVIVEKAKAAKPAPRPAKEKKPKKKPKKPKPKPKKAPKKKR
eukprot:TRINITY_DN74490_c0_g1_i1.p1 TRINITY_DN74490_c0_g1~~TRINITY_DN74490_c0_g1_i1.p1  ORF type:complete len:705 (-),score=138.38 TRINITY_DN74490_c0_g1_i1:43-2157(-)